MEERVYVPFSVLLMYFTGGGRSESVGYHYIV